MPNERGNSLYGPYLEAYSASMFERRVETGVFFHLADLSYAENSPFNSFVKSASGNKTFLSSILFFQE